MAQGLLGAVIGAWPDFRRAMRAELARPQREERLLAYVYLASLLGLVAGLPSAFAQAEQTEVEDALQAILLGRLFAALFAGPLVLYGLAALSHLAARSVGGQGSWYGARLALFWALLVATPLLLGLEVLTAFVPDTAAGPVSPDAILAFVSFAGFAWIWAACLAEAEKFEHKWPVAVAILMLPCIFFVISVKI